MEIIAPNLNSQHISVSNNAIWVVGEMCMQLGSEMKIFAPMFVENLVTIINTHVTPKTLHENTGRLIIFIH